MSLEQALASLEAAVNANTKALQELMASATGSDAPAETTAPAPAAQPPKPRGRPRQASATTPAPAAKPAPAPAAKPAPAPAPAPATNGAQAPAMEYAQLREAVLAVAKTKGHSVALGVLGKFGVKVAQELKPEQYQAVFDEMQTELVA